MPFGSYDRHVLRALRRTGVTRVYTSDGGWARPGDLAAGADQHHRERRTGLAEAGRSTPGVRTSAVGSGSASAVSTASGYSG